MRELVKLNQLVTEKLGLSISYNSYGENFLWNDIWVTEIGKGYFQHKIREIEVYVKEHIDYSKGVEVGFLNRIREKLLSTFKEIKDIQREFIPEISYTINSEYRGFPEQGVMDFPGQHPLDIESHESTILDILKEYHDFELEDLINATEEMTEALEKGKFEGGKKMEKKEIKMLFAKAHLIYILRLHQSAISNLLSFIENYFETVDGLAEDYFVDNEYVALPSLNSYELEFNLSKEKIAILFYNLFESGLIKTEGTTSKIREANLKGYLDNANIFFRVKGKKTRLGGTKNEFNKVKSKFAREDYDIDGKEVELLKHLISVFNKRIEEIEN